MKNHFALFLILLLSSCVHDVDIEIGEFQQKMVINSIFNSSEAWSIKLTNSRNILDQDSQILPIEDASVIIIESDTRKIFELIHQSDGIYTSNALPEIGKKYELEVAHPDYGVATAITSVPSSLELEAIDTATVEHEGERSLRINFNILDNEEEENFYVWDLVTSQEDEIDILPTKEAYLSSLDGDVEIINDRSNIQHSKLFISDREFNGGQHNTSFITFEDVKSFQNTDPQNGKKLKLRVLSVSKDLFEYLKSVEESYRSQNINTSSVYPVDYEFNISNGIGIFGAYKQILVDI